LRIVSARRTIREMRVITYVPRVHGADRTRRAIEREVRRQGHEIIGQTDSRAEAQAALSSGVADMVAGRPEHLLELAPWALGVARRAATASGLALPVWAIGQVRRHPPRVATAVASAAALAAAVALAAQDRASTPPPAALPPALPSASAPRVPGTNPPSVPGLLAPPSAPPPAVPSAGGPAAPPRAAAPAQQPLSRGPAAPTPPGPTAPVPATGEPPTTAPAVPPSPTEPECLLRLSVAPLLDLRLCLGPLSS
jgi:hypothetical protein